MRILIVGCGYVGLPLGTALAKESHEVTGISRTNSAENALRAAGIKPLIAGIYGPERGHLFKQYLQGEAVIEGKGQRVLNMIHRDDVIGAIVVALKSGRRGEIYNAVDDEPVTQMEFYQWLSTRLLRSLPPS